MSGLRLLVMVETVAAQDQRAAENQAAVVLRWISIALFVLAVLATVLAVTGIVLQRRADRLRANVPAEATAKVPGTFALASPQDAGPESGAVRLVVVDPLTVLYGQTLNIEVYLLPFIRDRQGTARTDTVLEACSELRSGSIDTVAFWKRCGVAGPADELDQHYAAARTMTADATAFLAEMQRRRIPVAAATTDVAPWSEVIRDRDRLSAIWPWLVSSTVGATTAERALFTALRRESGVSYEHCLYVDTRLATLDTAKQLGMKTALLDAGGTSNGSASVGHSLIADLTELLGSKLA